MTITLSDRSPRESYTVAQGVTQTQFTVPFEFFDAEDLNFYVDGTKKDLTTHYTVTGGSGATGTINTTAGNSVTGITGGSTVVVTRSIALDRITDFPSSGAFDVAKLNTELDRFTAIADDISDDVVRSLQLADDDPASSMTLPSKADRLGTVLGFNETTGAAEAGPTIANVSSLAAITGNINTLGGISADITTVAHLQDGTTATNAISNLASITTAISGVNAISTEVQQAYTDRVAIQNASANATLAENYAIKTDGAVESSNYSSKAWALGGTGVTDTAGSGASKEWATDTTNTVDGTEYSAKEYAIGTQSGQTNGSSKQWAIGGGAGFDVNTTVNGSEYSAKYYAELASSYVDSFDDTYLGDKSSDPLVDNDGDALSTGDLYFNTVSNILRVYNGSSWQDAATDTSTFAGQGFAVAMAIAL
jgi:hypothetical protein